MCLLTDEESPNSDVIQGETGKQEGGGETTLVVGNPIPPGAI